MCFASSSLFARPAANAFLFEVTRDGKSAHIFGTLHAGVPMKDLSPKVRQAVDAASLAVEESVRPDRLTHYMNKYRFHVVTHNINSPTLSARLNRGEYRRLVQRLNQRGYPASIANELSPAGALLYMKIGQELSKGELDVELDRHFRQRHVRLVGLDSEASKVERIRHGMTFDILREELNSDPKEERDSTREMIEAYYAGDADYFVRYNEGSETLKKLNEEWMPRIEKIMAVAPGAFFFVGVGHLLGSEGLLAKLESDGYSVKAVQ